MQPIVRISTDHSRNHYKVSGYYCSKCWYNYSDQEDEEIYCIFKEQDPTKNTRPIKTIFKHIVLEHPEVVYVVMDDGKVRIQDILKTSGNGKGFKGWLQASYDWGMVLDLAKIMNIKSVA